ncbi:MAG: hypothetical protein AB7P14_14125 [Blastocatellales bacterium]
MLISIKPCYFCLAVLFALTLISTATAQSTAPTAKWSTTRYGKHASNTVEFFHGTYTRLNNGTVIATGSRYLNGDDALRSSVEIYDPVTGTWNDADPMHFPRTNHDALLLADGRLLVIGGVKPSSPAPIEYAGPPEIYDPATGKWTVLNLTGVDLSNRYGLIPFIASHFLLPSGKVLIIGGFGRVETFFLDPNTGHIVEGPKYLQQNGAGFVRSPDNSAAILFNGSLLLRTSKRLFTFDPDDLLLNELPTPKVGDSSPDFVISTILPTGEAFSILTSFTGVQEPILNYYHGIFDGNLWKDIAQRNFGDPGNSLTASVPLTSGTEVLTIQSGVPTLYNTITKTARLTDYSPSRLYTPVLLADGRVLAGESIYGIDFGVTPTITSTTSASYRVEPLARNSIASVFGSGIGGHAITIKGSDGVQYNVPTVFADTPNQINFLIPETVPYGQAEMTVGNQKGLLSITDVSPGIFTANANGRGAPAAVLLRVKGDGTQIYEPVVEFNPATGSFDPIAIDQGSEADQLILVLFGTGMKNNVSTEKTIAYIGDRRARVQYIGAQGDFLGLDQVNLILPKGLSSSTYTVRLTVNGKTANEVIIRLK